MVNLCLIVGSWGGGDETGEYSKAKTHLINQKQATAEEMCLPCCLMLAGKGRRLSLGY